MLRIIPVLSEDIKQVEYEPALDKNGNIQADLGSAGAGCILYSIGGTFEAPFDLEPIQRVKAVAYVLDTIQSELERKVERNQGMGSIALAPIRTAEVNAKGKYTEIRVWTWYKHLQHNSGLNCTRLYGTPSLFYPGSTDMYMEYEEEENVSESHRLFRLWTKEQLSASQQHDVFLQLVRRDASVFTVSATDMDDIWYQQTNQEASLAPWNQQ